MDRRIRAASRSRQDRCLPGDDVGARNNLAKWLDLKDALDYNSVNQALAKWRPYAGLLYFHLLLDNLAASPGSRI